MDLAWLFRPAWHGFRWRDDAGRWYEARRRVREASDLAREFARAPPRDAYVTTAAWLEPRALPRLLDAEATPPILLDHLVAFDVDRGFSLRALESARREALRIREWGQSRGLLPLHASFSGAKGFHVLFRDPDRAPFAIADPRAREATVRSARARLVRAAHDAGLEFDPTVTADTRRILRLPGTFHGETGFACWRVPEALLERPLREWIERVPRREGARAPPRFALPRLRRAGLRAPPAAAPRALELQASTHVPGTRDREALLAWAGSEAAARALARRCDAGPALLWRQGERRQGERWLVLVPRAFPRAALAARAGGGLARALDARGHAWVAVAPRRWADGTQEPAIVPAGILEGASAHPWSAAHVALARRLGHEVHGTTDASGSAEPSLRLAQIG